MSEWALPTDKQARNSSKDRKNRRTQSLMHQAPGSKRHSQSCSQLVLRQEGLKVYLCDLIKQLVKHCIVWPLDVVNKLMKHCAN